MRDKILMRLTDAQLGVLGHRVAMEQLFREYQAREKLGKKLTKCRSISLSAKEIIDVIDEY